MIPAAPIPGSAPDRILIVGAGVIGAAIAFRLARGGAAVTVVEAAMPAAGASGRSFGWINASFSLNEAHFHFRLAAMTAHHALLTDLGPTPTLWNGAISWEDDPVALDETYIRLGDAGYPVRRLGRAALAKLEPNLDALPEVALFFPAEGVTDLAGLTRRLLTGAAAAGARLLLGLSVTGLETRNGTVTGLATEEGVIEADQVILAAGTGTPALLAPFDIPLPLAHRPALLLRSRPLPPLLRHVLVTPDIELRQEADGRILAPTSPGHQADAATALAASPEALADRTLSHLRALLPVRGDLDWEEALRAERPVPADGLPVVGPAALPGLYLAVMHSGATLAALIGDLVAREVLEGRTDPMLAPYRPARFL